jgi:hypothetical protein
MAAEAIAKNLKEIWLIDSYPTGGESVPKDVKMSSRGIKPASTAPFSVN